MADTEATGKAGTFTSSALNCRLLPPPPPAGTPAALPWRIAGRVGGRDCRRGPGRRHRRQRRPGRRAASPGAAPDSRLRARPGPPAAGTRAPAPPPLAAGRVAAAPAAAGSSPPPLFFVRCERRRWCGARAEAPSLPRPLLRGEGPKRGCPAPPRPPSVPPALSGSCLLLLLLLPVVQAPPSLLSFAARISLEFYSLPHVTHRVKLHLRRVTHQHSASPSRPGHRQQQPPPTEDSQPGSQPAPPSAECAAAAHGNSRARSGGARAAPPSALEAEVAEDFRVPSGAAEGFLRERESGSGLGPGGGGEGVCLSAPAALAAYRRFKAGGGNLQEELGSGGSAPRIRRETWRPPAGPFNFGARRPWDSGQLAEFSRAARTARPVGHTFGLRAMTCPDRV
ncbi:hypothetical protein CapIbe_001415 [Capra ibex]